MPMSAAVRLARHLECLTPAEMAALSDCAGVQRKIGARARAGRKVDTTAYMLLCTAAGIDAATGAPASVVPRAGATIVWWIFGFQSLPHMRAQTARPSRRCRPRRSVRGDPVASRAVPAGSGRKLPAHLRLHRDPGKELPLFHREHELQHIESKGTSGRTPSSARPSGTSMTRSGVIEREDR
jgi:hypothetical protein